MGNLAAQTVEGFKIMAVAIARDTKCHDHDRPDGLVVVFWSGWDYEA